MCDAPVGCETMSSALPKAENHHRWIRGLIEPHLRGPALEVGFGYGQYTRALACLVDELVAVDIDERMRSWLGDLPDHVRLMTADASDPTLPGIVGAEAFNTIVCLNVLEHIEHDRRTLRSFLKVLRPGGALALLVPAHQALFGHMDALAGHLRRYSARMLRERLQETGFEVRELKYVNPLGGAAWWLNARLLKPTSLSDPAISRQILWYDRFVQPVSRAINPLTSRVFGQSVWALATRPVV